MSFYIIGLGQASSLLSCCLAASSSGRKRYPEADRSKQEGRKAPEGRTEFETMEGREENNGGGKNETKTFRM